MFWKDLTRKRSASRLPWSLAGRLTAWYTIISLSFIVCTAAILYWALTTNMNRDDDLFLGDKVHVLRAILRDRPNDVAGLREEVELETAARRYEQFFVRLIDEHGRQNLTTSGMDALIAPALFAAPVPADREPGGGIEIHLPTGRLFLALAAQAALGHSDRAWTIQVAVDRTHDELLLAAYRRWLWLVLSLAVVACPVVGHRIAKHAIRPVQEITRIAARTGSENLEMRIEPRGYPVELAALASTLNAMLGRLEEAFGRLSRFSADIAHELRTPVNNLRGEAEVTLARGRSVEEYRDALGSCLEESARLSQLIESLLFLARAESPGTHLVRQPVHVVKELLAIRDYYEALATEAGVTISVAAYDETVSELDRVLLQRAVGNLVENAVAHTPRGGSVTLGAHIHNGLLSIEVADTGAGIAAEHLPHVFDRFYRAEPARPSRGGHIGLGLAIVHAIVKLHGGAASISSEVGRGTRVTLMLPRRESSPI
jgi:two-component system heavy metal sensor histidine kinase CusS